MKNVLEFMLSRLKERSTWVGLVSIATAAGVGLSPELQEAIAVAGMSLAGLIMILTNDKK